LALPGVSPGIELSRSAIMRRKKNVISLIPPFLSYLSPLPGMFYEPAKAAAAASTAFSLRYDVSII